MIEEYMVGYTISLKQLLYGPMVYIIFLLIFITIFSY